MNRDSGSLSFEKYFFFQQRQKNYTVQTRNVSVLNHHSGEWLEREKYLSISILFEFTASPKRKSHDLSIFGKARDGQHMECVW